MKLPSCHRGAISELVASAWLLELGYEVFRNISGGGPADLIAWNHTTGEKLVIDVKTWLLSNQSQYPSSGGNRTKTKDPVHCLYVSGDKVIGFWRKRNTTLRPQGSERYWPLAVSEPVETYP